MSKSPLPCPLLHTFQTKVFPVEEGEGLCLTFQQAWREEPEADFLPGRVCLGWTPEGFVISAELADRDIFNPVQEFNEPAFLKGDVFEIFMQPPGSDAYIEFHITPHNQHFQYGIPSAAAFKTRRGKGICQDWLISAPVLESSTEIDPKNSVWRIFAKIPVEKLDLLPLKPQDLWKFSFCRYDYSRDRAKPTLSSTSPLNKIDFHDQSCWKSLVLV